MQFFNTLAGSLALTAVLAPAAVASEDWSKHPVQQQATVKIYGSVSKGKAVGGKAALLDTYLATRDSASSKAASQPQAVASVDMTFPVGSKANPIGSCPLWPTEKPWNFARFCASSKVGEGWALVSGMGTSPMSRLSSSSGATTAPSGSGNYLNAPADCEIGVSDQYSRSYESLLQSSTSLSQPLGGLPCTPRGYVWVHVKAYAGDGNGVVSPTTGKMYDRTDPKKARAARNLDKTAIVFANDNGIAALSFAGTIRSNHDKSLTLHVDMPAFNQAGLKGFLPLDNDLVDFRLTITNPRYITAPPCPKNKTWAVRTVTSYSPFPGDFAAGNTSHYSNQTVISSAACS